MDGGGKSTSSKIRPGGSLFCGEHVAKDREQKQVKVPTVMNRQSCTFCERLEQPHEPSQSFKLVGTTRPVAWVVLVHTYTAVDLIGGDQVLCMLAGCNLEPGLHVFVRLRWGGK